MSELHDQMQKLAASVPGMQSRFGKTASSTAEAKRILKEEENNTAAGCCTALRVLYGIDAYGWEPESIWLTLEKDGVESSLATRNKVQAGIALLQNPAFYWDNLVFQKTVKALNSESFTPEHLSECIPEEMCWAVHEAAVIRGLDPDDVVVPEFDDDVQLYTAVCLLRSGYACVPDELAYAEDALRAMLPKEALAGEDYRESWSKLDKTRLPDTEFAETSWGVQMAQLSSCHEHVRIQSELLAAELTALV